MGMSSTVLHEIADVQMGFSFRSGVEPAVRGPVGVIQMKDLGDDRMVTLGALTRVSMDVAPTHQVLAGDIILRSRGDRASSAIVAADPGHTLVAAPLLRIRITDARVRPAYLNWYINQPPAQAHLAKHAEGSGVKMISKRALDELEVDIPPLERQAAIVRLAALTGRAKTAEARLENLRARLASEVMLNYARGGEGR
jgi:hypothetical protein